MKLPQDVQYCVRMLEQAGFEAWAVGGCVRDHCLLLEPHDYDLTTSALPEETEKVFAQQKLVLAGKKHGTVGVILPGGVVEITTFRTEGGYRDNRRPDWVKFVSNVEADLARRDFTVNAMAWSPVRGICDPFGGQEDLKNRVLRAVGDPETRFREDSLRILRGVRFAVRYGLQVEEKTMRAMEELAPLMENLARERVFDELCKLLPLVTAEDLARFGTIISTVIPELKDTIGFDQRNVHHEYDLFTHIAHVTAAVSGDLALRWAALLHDLGKVRTFTVDEAGQGHFYGHAQVSAEMTEAILRRLKAPTALRERVVFLVEKHMTPLEPDKKLLRRRLSQYEEDAVFQLLELQQADRGSKGATEMGDLRYEQTQKLLCEILEENTCLRVRDLAVNGKDLLDMGYAAGPKVGETLNWLLEQVTEERLENCRESLLPAAKERLEQQNT